MFKLDQQLFPNTFSRVSSFNSIPVREDILFANAKGEEKARIRNAAQKRLSHLGPALQKLLTQDEIVLFTARAQMPMSGLEQYSLGWFAQIVGLVTLVITNKRLLAFRVNRDGSWRENVRSCAYGDIKDAKFVGFISHYATLKYADGTKEKYWGLDRAAQKMLGLLLPTLLQASSEETTATKAMASLCPACTAQLRWKNYECQSCGQKFRDESPLPWRILIPGGVYFYARQTGLGIVHALVDTIFMLETLALLVVFATSSAAQRQNVTITLGYWAFLLLIEKAIAFGHARKFLREFIPVPGTSRAEIPRFSAATAGR
jgi:hypothetical protein